MSDMKQKMDDQIKADLHPLEHSGEIFHFDEYLYRTQADIIKDQIRAYALEFMAMALTSDDPQFTREIINKIEQTMYFIDIEEIFESL